MKKVVIAALLLTLTAFAEEFVLDNQTAYPEKNKKIAIQWASSAQEVDSSNKALLYQGKLNRSSLYTLKQPGTVNVNIPKKAAYFRMVVWSKGDNIPDLSTNWIEIVPGTTYTLKTEHLTPIVLMSGMGC